MLLHESNMRYIVVCRQQAPSMAKVRGTPRTHIDPKNLDRLKDLSADLGCTIFDALQITLKAGFEAIELGGVNPKDVEYPEKPRRVAA
jgi:hypothetical protein